MDDRVNHYLKVDGEDNSYTFSVRAFKGWKKNFLKKYEQEYGVSFKSDVPNPLDREIAYKKVFQMENLDLFGTGNRGGTVLENIFQRVLNVQNILEMRK